MSVYSHTPSHNDTHHIRDEKAKPEQTKKEHVITIYSTSSCPFCIYAKDFFTNHNIPFTEKNVGKDQEAAREMVSKSRQTSVPVIDINGTILVGYQPEEFAKLLGITE